MASANERNSSREDLRVGHTPAWRPFALKMAADVVLFAAAYILAFQFRLDRLVHPHDLTLWVTLPGVVLVKLLVFLYLGGYRSIWRYSSLTDLEKLIRGTLIAGIAVLGIAFLLPENLSIPRSIPFIDMALTILFTGGMRMLVRSFHESVVADSWSKIVPRGILGLRMREHARRALVVGAGDAGEMIVREMIRSSRMESWPLAFVDDDPAKYGQSIHGVPVLGGRERIPELVDRLDIQDVLIAIPSASGNEVREIIQHCKDCDAELKILPDLNGTVDEQLHVSDLRRVKIEDLLGRETAELDMSLISNYVRGKRVLVTGAGGSIGSELCRQILRFAPSEIQLMGRGENSIYEIHGELRQTAGMTHLVQIIGDVINKKKLEGIFAMFRPQIVFHAGADKHVPLMEMNPDEAVFNNIVGTRNVLEVADANGVDRVVCISTDKAVNPTSVMGCCKRVAEMLIQSGQYRNTVAVAVRFGNVLGSRGSVIPLFERQIDAGGPISVTHREISRYFMTIPEAAGLVIQAGAMGTGGEIFVLDMGEPVKIWDLAHSMVRLAGLEPGVDIEIREIGLRPGEKLHEDLAYGFEDAVPTLHPKITCVQGSPTDGEFHAERIEELAERAIRMEFHGIRRILREIVPEFRSEEDLEQERASVGG